MSNNRLFIVCSGCGSTFLLASRAGSGYEVGCRRLPSLGGSLDTFLSEHERCGWIGMGTADPFASAYEDELEGAKQSGHVIVYAWQRWVSVGPCAVWAAKCMRGVMAIIGCDPRWLSSDVARAMLSNAWPGLTKVFDELPLGMFSTPQNPEKVRKAFTRW